MKAMLGGFLAAMLLLPLTGCGRPVSAPVDDTRPAAPAEETEETAVTLTVGEQTFSAVLLENETAREFADLLPMTLDMSELNGNEKYFYLDGHLSTHVEQPGQINAGDLMLYGDNCLVLFYETFSSSYSYTRLGHMDDPSGLAEALGTGSITVSFALEE